MTGGGFGGCTVTLVASSAVPALLSAIATEYPKKCAGKHATTFTTRPAAGAMVVQAGLGAEPEACAALRVQPRRAAHVGVGVALGAGGAMALSWLMRGRK